MTRKTRARNNIGSSRNRKDLDYRRNVRRNSLNIRYDPKLHLDTFTTRLPSRNKINPKNITQSVKVKPNLLLRKINRYLRISGIQLCKEKQLHDDQSRRRKFFRAKSKGNAGARPEHIRKYKRC